MEIQKIYPLIIKDISGKIMDVSISNQKGFNKSVERNTLWHLHNETGRLLPYNENVPLVSIVSRHSWYEAVLKTERLETAEDPAQKTDGPSLSREDSPDVLTALEEIILKRKAELPEGSYTTHLFTSGSEKIRKKTGEEAVELILAKNRDDIIYEAADLIYHLMVLLASEDISINSVLEELSNR